MGGIAALEVDDPVVVLVLARLVGDPLDHPEVPPDDGQEDLEGREHLGQVGRLVRDQHLLDLLDGLGHVALRVPQRDASSPEMYVPGRERVLHGGLEERVEPDTPVQVQVQLHLGEAEVPLIFVRHLRGTVHHVPGRGQCRRGWTVPQGILLLGQTTTFTGVITET